MKEFWRQLFRLDRNANADLFDGEREETMSGRMGRKLLEGDNGCCRFRKILCAVLSMIDPEPGDHCINTAKKGL
jgi:hypothetical protein